jgi:ABC-type branched-subunit amino acid transport system substrate-binding protein
MGRKSRMLVVFAAAAGVVAIAAAAALGGHTATPGVTATEVKIGGTFPLTGFASSYKTIPLAEKAYYDYVNAHGGVNGRKINFEILDDSYDPSKRCRLHSSSLRRTAFSPWSGASGPLRVSQPGGT